MKNQAFTLIELLVVVLIIGILVAIAVPQYQLSIDKSHFANLQAQVKSIKSSFDNYYLATGQYPDSFDNLDIGFSGFTKTKPKVGGVYPEECYIFEDSYCCLGRKEGESQNENIFCGMNDYSFAYGYYDGKYRCVAANENDRAQHVCKNLNTEYYRTLNIVTPYGHKDNNGKRYSYYTIL